MSISRKLLERFSRNIVLKRKLPHDLGNIPLMVSPGAALQYWKTNLENFDPMLLNTVRNYISSGQVVWDIGANMGLFSFAAAYKVGKQGKVLAVEADTWCVNLLRKSCVLKENKGLVIDVLPVAISNSVGIAQFNIAQRGRATNFLSGINSSAETGGVRETVLIPCISLDWLLERYAKPDFIKIDIEGAEKLALEGSTNILSSIRPKILCEVLKTNRDYIANIFSQFNYSLFDAQTTSGVPVRHISTDNIIAIPN